MTRSAWIGGLGMMALLGCSGGGNADKTGDMTVAGDDAQATAASGSGGTAPGSAPTGGTGGVPNGMMNASGGNASIGAGGSVGAAGMDAVADCPDCPIAPNCQGFPLEGLQYSPGGSALPNKCVPFDVTTNNPYAVRCIDAIPIQNQVPWR